MSKSKIAVVGLGSMGQGIALSLMSAGFDVVGCDPNPAACRAIAEAGGRIAGTPAEAAEGALAVLCVVVNGAQTEEVLFGPDGCARQLDPEAVFVSMATISPDLARDLAARLGAIGPGYIDAPISGGAAKAATGQLSVMASGAPDLFERLAPVFDAIAEHLYRLGEEPGPGSAFKIVNQLLAGVHIAVASEAMAFAAAQGLDLAEVYRVITGSAGNSWMFEDRMGRLVAGDRKPRSTTDIFVKDLGIVTELGRTQRLPLPLSAAALQMFLATSANGMGTADDSSVAQTYARLMGLAEIGPEAQSQENA